MALQGRVKNGVIVLLGDTETLPEGTLVRITPLTDEVSTPPSRSAGGEGPPYYVSKEQKEALLGLIGMCKIEHPPSDEEVEQIVEEAIMEKHG